jgi:TonB family protein
MLALAAPAHAGEPSRIAVLDAGAGPELRTAVATAAARTGTVLDAALVDSAARGAGYTGSANMSREEARRLGLVVGADALVLVVASEIERASDNAAEAWDLLVGLLLVEGRTGELLRYKGLRALGAPRAQVRERAFEAIRAETGEWDDRIRAAEERRLAGAGPGWDPAAVDFVTNPEGGDGLVPPRFFRRPAPGFTDDADRMRVVATVDLLVQFNADGTYGRIDVVRWAGFGLDEAAIDAVRACKFWPARRSERPVSARALLRYNFRFRDR